MPWATPRRARRSVRCSCGAGLSGVKKCLPREQQEEECQDENGVLEDPPGEAQPLALAGQYPGQHAHRERSRDREADDSYDDEHLGKL